MKFLRASILLILLGLCLLLNMLSGAQSTKDNEQDYSKFLLDANKPYVYLEVDHVGPRKPLRNDEPTMGIWLHLKNNCRLPIVVLAIGDQSGNSALSLEDEVVPNAEVFGAGEDARMAGVVAPRV